MTETKIAKELMKELKDLKSNRIDELKEGYKKEAKETDEEYDRRLEIYFNEEKRDYFSYINIAKFYDRILMKISTQLEANKRFLEFLESMQGWMSWEDMTKFAQGNIKTRILDLQQAIKILEGK
jgi:hypothetical protein